MTKTELNEIREKSIREARLMRYWDRMYHQRKRENAKTYLLDEAYRNWLWSEGGFIERIK